MPQREPMTLESAQTSAAEMNKYGAILKKFGMKILFHNHAGEFELLKDSKQTQYDVILAETDPELVTMQIDIGWAHIAGQNILDLFKKHPGRFELWHVKDALGLKGLDSKLTPNQRAQYAYQVPIGQGELDWKSIFAAANVAGLKYFIVEQDNPSAWGDSIMAFKVSYQYLYQILS